MVSSVPGLKKIQAVPSTAHGMLKFPVEGGIVTLRSNAITPAECIMVAGASKESPPIETVVAEGIKVAIHHEYPEQIIIIGESLSKKGKMELCDMLKNNLDVFAWKSSNMTGVLRYIAEHRLNIREGCPPIRQKKKRACTGSKQSHPRRSCQISRSQIMMEVHYYNWLSNPVMVKKHDGN
ncbi:hypothetical protein Tco_0205567 [Tanacetum coccineum]